MFDVLKIDVVKKDIEKYQTLLELDLPLDKKKLIKDLLDDLMHHCTQISNSHQASTGVIDPKLARDSITALREIRRNLDNLYKNARI